MRATPSQGFVTGNQRKEEEGENREEKKKGKKIECDFMIQSLEGVLKKTASSSLLKFQSQGTRCTVAALLNASPCQTAEN